MAFKLNTASIFVNNEVVPIVPESFTFTEGLGEQTIETASIGGGVTEQVFSEDVTTAASNPKFEMYPTIENIALARSWKGNRNANVVAASGTTPDGQVFSRTFTQAALTNNYEVNLGSANIAIEFMANTAV